MEPKKSTVLALKPKSWKG